MNEFAWFGLGPSLAVIDLYINLRSRFSARGICDEGGMRLVTNPLIMIVILVNNPET